MITSIITPREIARNYKQIFEKVKKTKQPVVVVSQKQPQVAIVSLDDLEKLQQLKYKNSGKALLDIAKEAHQILKDANLPKDLAQNHDYYAWGGEKKNS